MKKLLTFDEARELLNTSKAHLRYLVFHKKLPYIKLNRLIRFDYDDLANWINQNKASN